jgi:hypothetical protein
MAQFLLRNSLNPNKAVKCGITFRQVVPKEGDGEAIWLVEIATNEPDVSGNSIPPEYVNVRSLTYLGEEIKEAVENIAAKIDWTPLIDDTRVPYVDSIRPSDYEVELETSIEIVLKEILPAAGIDIDSIIMTVNGFDVTDELEITGDPYEYKVIWNPTMRVTEEY